MKVKIKGMDNTSKSDIELPNQFVEEFRPDLIKRAVLTIEANTRQVYGADPRAGMKQSAYVSKRRRDYKSTYGIGQSRTPRKVMSSRGTRFNWVGAVAPQTVGGRKAHAPKADKIWGVKLNNNERRKAIRSAISASINNELIKVRGHVVPVGFPFVVESAIEDLVKTKDVVSTLDKLGFSPDLSRSKKAKFRAGRGKTRGRTRKVAKSVLIVVSSDSPLRKAARNIPGVEVTIVNNLNAKLLAPGCIAGRLTLYTEAAIKYLKETSIFTGSFKVVKGN